LNNIKDSLNALLKKRELYVKVKGTVTPTKWREIVGDTLSQYATPIYYKEGVLYIGVVSSLFKRELESMKGEILSKIKSSIGESPIVDVKFRIADSGVKIPLKSNSNKKPSLKQAGSVQRIDVTNGIQLEENDIKWIEENVKRLKSDDKLVIKYRNLLKAFKELEAKKKIAGYKKCKKCGALFKGKGLLCPVCEIKDKKKN